MSITVRPATQADAETVARFAVELFDLHVNWDAERFAQIADREGARRFYCDRAEDGQVLVAENDGQVIGFAYFEYRERDYADLLVNAVWLHDLFVAEHARRSGAGSELIKAVKNEAHRLGADKIVLSVAAANDHGQAFFKRSGFRTTMYEMMTVPSDDGTKKG